MKTYKKVLIAIGILILDFLISYFILKLFIHFDSVSRIYIYTSSKEFYYALIALMFIVPLALNIVALGIWVLVKLIHSIYIGIRHGFDASIEGHRDNQEYYNDDSEDFLK